MGFQLPFLVENSKTVQNKLFTLLELYGLLNFYLDFSFYPIFLRFQASFWWVSSLTYSYCEESCSFQVLIGDKETSRKNKDSRLSLK